MDDRTKFNLLQGLKSGLLNERQSFDAIQAIKEDRPTSDVSDLMASLAFSGMNSGESLSQITDKKTGRDREMFDYGSGADGKLRALMSFGETEGDREAILRSNVGEDGYVRDPSGRLALTETGQKARGMEPVGKNLIIEDEGFSMRDFSDFAGILPETLGSIGGAIAGGGFTFGLGSIGGAALGAAGGQALEEAIESYLGVQTQSLGEVARDVAIEGVIGAGGEVAGAILAAGARGLMGAGKSLAGRAGGSLSAMDEVTLKNLDEADRRLGKGYVQSMRSLNAPEPIAYTQLFGENVTKNTTRMDRNLAVALEEKKAFTDAIRGDSIEALGENVKIFAPAKFSKLENNIKKAHKETFNAIDTGMKMLYTSVDDGLDLNAKTLTRITDSFQAFDDVSRAAYDAIDATLAKIQVPATINGRQVVKEGGSLKIFDTRSLMSKFDEMIEEHSTSLLEGPVGLAYNALTEFGAKSEGRASFRNLVSLRKHVNDSLMFGAGTQGTKQLDSVKGLIDNMLDGENILDAMTFTGRLSTEDAGFLSSAAKMRKIANDEYRKGITKFEDVSRLGVIGEIKNLKKLSDAGPREISDKFFSKVVQKDSPERLQAVINAVEDSGQNELLDELGGRFFSMALSDSKLNSINPEAFNGKKFATNIMSLGTTGPKLFGKEWGEIKKLAKVMEQTSIKNTLTFDDVQRVMDSGGSQNLVDSLTSIVKTNKEQTEALTASVIKTLQDPNKTASYSDVARALTNHNLTEGETRQIMKFFDNNSQMKMNMRNVVLEDILNTVDDDVFSNPAKANSLKKKLESYKPGSLKQIFNDDEGVKTFQALKEFGDDLAIIGGDAAKEGAIAASGTFSQLFSHPLNVLGRLAKFRGIVSAFSRPESVKAYIAMRRATINNPEARGQAVIGLMNQAAIEEGINLGSVVSKVGGAARGVASVARQGSRISKNVLPRALFRQEDGSGTNIPQIQQPEMPRVSMPGTMPIGYPSAPAGVIDILRSNVNQELRERARQSPAAAATLLGGLGSADLL
tara:strand:- start:38 stop:3109 length:3072 start_codon:yes stop_codon:yes gene_type:complete